MIEQQQKVFDRVVREVSETEKIPSALLKGGGGGQKNLEWEREKLEISSQYTIAPYNKGAYQVIGKQYKGYRKMSQPQQQQKFLVKKTNREKEKTSPR